jgi:hypothetical protein
MKKVILLLLLLGIFAVGQSQNRSKGFFKPVPNDLLTKGDRALNQSVWLFRPAVTLTAIQLNWNKESKGFDASALSSAGMGVSYAHFIEANGLPYNNFSVNAVMLLGADIQNPSPATISFALTGTLFEYLNLGGLYNFSTKSFGILTGVQIKF